MALIAPQRSLGLLVPGPGFAVMPAVPIADDTVQFELNVWPIRFFEYVFGARVHGHHLRSENLQLLRLCYGCNCRNLL